MELDSSTLARGRQAVFLAARDFLFDPNVRLIDFGFPETDGVIREDALAIRIHVQRKMYGDQLEAAAQAGVTQVVPESIGGFPTDVPEGVYRYGLFGSGMEAVNQRASRCNPLRGGISISSERQNAFGTLGGLVRDRQTGQDMILSNWHVLVGDWGAPIGQQIYQPGRLDGGMPQDTIASLTRHAMWSNLDAAVATLNGERSMINDQFDLGPVQGVVKPSLGMPAVKSGRRTELTRGRVTAVEGMMVLSYSGLQRVIRNVTTIEPYSWWQEVSAPGDSGSLWLAEETMQVFGLHFAGSDAPMERALGLDMSAVLDALQVDLVTDTSYRYQIAGGMQRAGAYR